MKIYNIRCVIFTAFFMIFAQNAVSQTSRVALVQSNIYWGDMAKNISAFEAKIESVDGCDMIILPELFTSGCDMRKRDKELKEAEKQMVADQYLFVIEKMQQWAEGSGAVIVGSTIFQQDGKFYNRLLAVYPSGEYTYYDKHNCFKMGAFAAGEDHVVIEVNERRYATYICYDLQFSEWSRNNGHYDCAIYIANWPESREQEWNTLLRQRAEENSAYVIGVNCVGVDLGGINYMGDSSFYSAGGELIDKCETGQEQILIVQL